MKMIKIQILKFLIDSNTVNLITNKFFELHLLNPKGVKTKKRIFVKSTQNRV